MRNRFMLSFFMLAGCAPSYSGWEGLMSSNIGKQFYPQEEFLNANGKNFFAGANDVREIDSVYQEGDDTRYYLTWKACCKYSILVDAQGTIISWRRESPNKQGCYIF